MDRYRNAAAAKFGIVLRKALKTKYPLVKITAVFLASQFNLRATTSDTISNETSRKWLNGVSLPSIHRYHVLKYWLDLDGNLFVRGDENYDDTLMRDSFIDNIKFDHIIFAASNSEVFNEDQILFLRKIISVVKKY